MPQTPSTLQQKTVPTIWVLTDGKAGDELQCLGVAERQGLPYGGYVDLASKAKVLELVADCIDKVNADLASEPGMADTQVARFLVLHKELDPDDDELTRTRKVRRNFIADKYGVLVEALYTGKQQQFIETLVKFEDGRTGSVSATLTIVEAKLHPASAKAAA